VIKIYFNDPTERPVTIYHILKLFQSPNESEVVSSSDSKGLVSESYEEIVFQEPTQLMQQMLTNVQPMTSGEWFHDTDCNYFAIPLPLAA
jgi:YEATS domain-containing protein 4